MKRYLIIVLIIIALAVVGYFIWKNYRKIPGTNISYQKVIRGLQNLYYQRVINKSAEELLKEQWIKDWLRGLYDTAKGGGVNNVGFDTSVPFEQQSQEVLKKGVDHIKEFFSVSESAALNLIKTSPRLNAINDLKSIGLSMADAEIVYNYLISK